MCRRALGGVLNNGECGLSRGALTDSCDASKTFLEQTVIGVDFNADI